ncbi:HAD-IA family hydrolase [Streptomyces bohaiensis]|uniref:HAD family hydrolase n=1 Tax=Streptomyces bohaiensis TaxID=1431344 RepID=UPI0028B20B0C|nr:HAD-IA family hydrolase [Streptomyces bohaiensis]
MPETGAVRQSLGVRAVVFDTDGVVTDSAPAHETAWREAFDACLVAAGRAPGFTPEDYRHWVDGRPRLDGAEAFLTGRGLFLPPGGRDDPPGTGTVAAVAARKEELFRQWLDRHRVAPWPGTVRLLRALGRQGVPCAAVSASRHATRALRSAGVLDLFAAVVDGAAARRLRLPGKPDPALFLEAVRRLGVPAREAAVVEDAAVGVEAGRRGGFALVVGVDRGGGPASRERLLRHGADRVVGDPGELLAASAPEEA